MIDGGYRLGVEVLSGLGMGGDLHVGRASILQCQHVAAIQPSGPVLGD